MQFLLYLECFPGSADNKESACNAGDMGSIPGSKRSFGEVNVYPLQYYCLENSMNRGAWQDTVQGIKGSDMTEQLNTFTVLTTRNKELGRHGYLTWSLKSSR